MSSAICDISSLLLIESFNRILALRISFSFFKKKKPILESLSNYTDPLV